MKEAVREIIELVGCPGAGKSTLCKLVADRLLEQGKTINKKKKSWRHFRYLHNKLHFFFVMMNPGCRDLYKIGRETIDDISDGSREYWLKVIVNNYFEIQKCEKHRCDYYLFDEGCLQSLSSFDHDRALSESVLKFADYVINEIYKDREIMIVFCDLDIKENVARLVHRNRENDRFMVGTDEEIEERLKVKKEKLLSLCKRADKEYCAVGLSRPDVACEEILGNV